MFVDTHSHLYDPAFSGEEDAAVERSLAAGVGKIILPDTDSSVRPSLFRLAARHPGVCFPTVGLHPEEVRENWEEELGAVSAACSAPVVAIGEIGLDFHWSVEFARQQEEVFRRQLDLARRSGLPVIIHTRDATEATLRIVSEFKGQLSGVFHAFSGSIETFREILRLGDFYVGIGGVSTYKKASIGETVRNIPLERIVLETDSPYLTPVPHRGERNESAYIPIIAANIAARQGIDPAAVEEVTTKNAETLFRI